MKTRDLTWSAYYKLFHRSFSKFKSHVYKLKSSQVIVSYHRHVHTLNQSFYSCYKQCVLSAKTATEWTAILSLSGLQISWCTDARIFSTAVVRLQLKQSLIWIRKGAGIPSTISTMYISETSTSESDSAASKHKAVHWEGRNIIFNECNFFNKMVSDEEHVKADFSESQDLTSQVQRVNAQHELFWWWVPNIPFWWNTDKSVSFKEEHMEGSER
jgi:hypothetical protein